MIKTNFSPVIKWTGSKRSQATEILKHFPREMDTYYEPFVGGGSIMRALLESDIKVNRVVCSDINSDLIRLWMDIKNQPDKLIVGYNNLWSGLKGADDDKKRKTEYYNSVRSRFNKTRDTTDFLFLLRTCANGLPRYNSRGEFNTSFHITRDGMRPAEMERIIREWNKLLQEHDVTFRCCSYQDIQSSLEDFLYLDPPYANTKGIYYGNICLKDFFAWMGKQKADYLLSFDGRCEQADNTYEVPEELFDNHFYIRSGNSSFRRMRGTARDSIVYESLYKKSSNMENNKDYKLIVDTHSLSKEKEEWKLHFEHSSFIKEAFESYHRRGEKPVEFIGVSLYASNGRYNTQIGSMNFMAGQKPDKWMMTMHPDAGELAEAMVRQGLAIDRGTKIERFQDYPGADEIEEFRYKKLDITDFYNSYMRENKRKWSAGPYSHIIQCEGQVCNGVNPEDYMTCRIHNVKQEPKWVGSDGRNMLHTATLYPECGFHLHELMDRTFSRQRDEIQQFLQQNDYDFPFEDKSLKTQEDLAGALTKAYPDGMTIYLNGMSREELMELQNYLDYDRDFSMHILSGCEGVINSQDTSSLEYGGCLDAKLVLRPEDYANVFPSDEYRSDSLEQLGLDWEDNAATVFLGEHAGNMDGAKVYMKMDETLFERMYIEGRPYADVIRSIENTKVTKDQELKILLNLQNIYEKGIGDNKVPECLHPYLDRYLKPDGQWVPDKKTGMGVHAAVDRLLKQVGYLENKKFNLSATFLSSAEAAKAAKIFNAHRDMFAVREDFNKVNICVNSFDLKVGEEAKNMLINNEHCLAWKQMPFRLLYRTEKSYLLLADGQVVTGYKGNDDLQGYRNYEIGLEGEYVPFGMMLCETEGNIPLYKQFATKDSFKMQDDMIDIKMMMCLEDIKEAAVVKNINFMQVADGVNRIYMSGRVGQTNYPGRRLNPQDAQLYQRMVSNGAAERYPEVLNTYFVRMYFEPEMKAESKRIAEFDKAFEKREQERLKTISRITEPRIIKDLYDGLWIKCRIDGIRQEARCLSDDYQKRLQWLAVEVGAKDDDCPNLSIHLHESVRLDIAANTYKDVLSNDLSQGERQGMKR